MKNSNKLFSIATLSIFPAFAMAQTCIGQNGTLGATTVTVSCSGVATTGATLATLNAGGDTCTFNFSPAISQADFSVRLYAVNSSETASFSFNGSPYAITAAELPEGYTLSGAGVTTNTSAAITAVKYFSFLNAPSSITSFTINNDSGNIPHQIFLGGVCTPVAPPAPTTPAAIPTLSEWAMIFMASLMAMFGIRRMRRSK